MSRSSDRAKGAGSTVELRACCSGLKEGQDAHAQKRIGRKREQRDVKKRGNELVRRHDRHRQQQEQASRVGVNVAIAVMSWAIVRTSVQVFHLARRRQLTILLTDLAGALCQLGSIYWLDFGGLLGIHRDGDLILHDSDIDLAIWQPSGPDWEGLEAGLRRSLPGYSLARQLPSECPDSLFLRVYVPLGFADLFHAAPAGAGRVLVDCGHGADGTAVDECSVFPLGTMRWAGKDISVPGDIEAVLAQRYGPTWRVPRYLDKGADTIEHNKWWNKLLRGIRYCTGIQV